MTTFDNRENAFENRFAHDEDLRFKAVSRRNKALGQWVAEKLGLTGATVQDYVRALQHAEAAEHGDAGVLAKLTKDLADKGVKVSDMELRGKMEQLLAEAVQQIDAGKP